MLCYIILCYFILMLFYFLLLYFIFLLLYFIVFFHTLLDRASSFTCTMCPMLSWDEASSPWAAQLCSGQTGARGGHGLGGRSAGVRAAVQQHAAAGTQERRRGLGGFGRAALAAPSRGGSSHGVQTLSWARHHDPVQTASSSRARMPSHLHHGLKSFS